MGMDLNPRLQQRLPDILEAIYESLNGATAPIRHAVAHVGELHEYLDFEIQKISLEIDRMDWESKAPPLRRTALEQRRKMLVEMQQAFPTEGVRSSIELLEGLADAIKLSLLDQPPTVEQPR